MATKATNQRKPPPKKAVGKTIAKSGTANQWATRTIAGVRSKQRGK